MEMYDWETVAQDLEQWDNAKMQSWARPMAVSVDPSRYRFTPILSPGKELSLENHLYPSIFLSGLYLWNVMFKTSIHC